MSMRRRKWKGEVHKKQEMEQASSTGIWTRRSRWRGADGGGAGDGEEEAEEEEKMEVRECVSLASGSVSWVSDDEVEGGGGKWICSN